MIQNRLDIPNKIYLHFVKGGGSNRIMCLLNSQTNELKRMNECDGFWL